MKRLIKILLAGLLYYSGLLRLTLLCRRLLHGNDECVILMYHRVISFTDPSSTVHSWESFRSLPGIVVSPPMFAKQIAFLVRHHTVIPLEDLVNCLTTARPIPKRAVVITFDDGWRDNFSQAFPILKRDQMPATIFLTTSFISTNQLFWPEQVLALMPASKDRKAGLAEFMKGVVSTSLRHRIEQVGREGSDDVDSTAGELIEAMKHLSPDRRDAVLTSLAEGTRAPDEGAGDQRVMLDWDEVHHMRQANICFGAHGVHHEILTQIDERRQHAEIEEAKGALVKQVAPRMLAFAYPNGNHNPHIRTLVRQAGYSCALSTQRGVVRRNNNLFALPRLNVHENTSRGWRGEFSPALFALHLSGIRW